MTVYRDEERATNLIWQYEEKQVDTLNAVILSVLALGVCIFWSVVGGLLL